MLLTVRRPSCEYQSSQACCQNKRSSVEHTSLVGVFSRLRRHSVLVMCGPAAQEVSTLNMGKERGLTVTSSDSEVWLRSRKSETAKVAHFRVRS